MFGCDKKCSKKMTEETRESWQCPTCTIAKAKGQTASRDPGEKTESQLAEITRKLDVLMSIGAKVDTLLSMKETVDKIELSVQHMSDQYDEILEEMKKQNQDIKELRERVGRLENSGTQRVVEALKQEVNELQQYSRRQNLEVHGFPCLPNENLWHKLKEVSDQLGVAELTENDVEALHRMPGKPDKVPPILVRFTSRLTRDRWFQARAVLKDNASGIWLMDNLTAQAKRLLWQAKTKAAERRYQFVWQKGGRIFVRKQPGDRPIRIDNDNDLAKIE